MAQSQSPVANRVCLQRNIHSVPDETVERSQSPVANRVCLLYLWKRLSGKGSQPEIQGSPENRRMKRKNSRISPLPPFVSYQKERRYAISKAQHPLKIPVSHYNRMRCKNIHTVITARKKEPSVFQPQASIKNRKFYPPERRHRIVVPDDGRSGSGKRQLADS